MDRPTRPDPATRDAEREEAEAEHAPDRDPTPEEERIADERSVDPDVAEHYEEMTERGAGQEGEGRLP